MVISEAADLAAVDLEDLAGAVSVVEAAEVEAEAVPQEDGSITQSPLGHKFLKGKITTRPETDSC